MLRLRFAAAWAATLFACSGATAPLERHQAAVSLDLRAGPAGAATARVYGAFSSYPEERCAPEQVGACTVDPCQPKVTYRDAGPLRVESGEALSLVVPRAPDGRYGDLRDVTGGALAMNAPVRFATGGGEAPAIDVSLSLPAAIHLTNPSPAPAVASAASTVTITLVAEAGDAELRFAEMPDTTLHAEIAGTPAVTCTWDAASGRATLPASVLARVRGHAGTLRSLRQVSTRVGDWDVDVAVAVPVLTPITAEATSPLVPAELAVR